MAPPTPGVLFLKQGDNVGCHCYIFSDLRNCSTNCEPDAPHGFPQLTTNRPAEFYSQGNRASEMLVVFLLCVGPRVPGRDAQV